jgi:hypothetical protein
MINYDTGAKADLLNVRFTEHEMLAMSRERVVRPRVISKLTIGLGESIQYRHLNYGVCFEISRNIALVSVYCKF